MASFLAEIGEEQDERASLSAVPMRSRGRTLALENVISTTFGREPHCPGLDLRAVGRSSGGSLAAGEEIPGSEGQEELHAIAGRWQAPAGELPHLPHPVPKRVPVHEEILGGRFPPGVS